MKAHLHSFSYSINAYKQIIATSFITLHLDDAITDYMIKLRIQKVKEACYTYAALMTALLYNITHAYTY